MECRQPIQKLVRLRQGFRPLDRDGAGLSRNRDPSGAVAAVCWRSGVAGSRRVRRSKSTKYAGRSPVRRTAPLCCAAARVAALTPLSTRRRLAQRHASRHVAGGAQAGRRSAAASRPASVSTPLNSMKMSSSGRSPLSPRYSVRPPIEQRQSDGPAVFAGFHQDRIREPLLDQAAGPGPALKERRIGARFQIAPLRFQCGKIRRRQRRRCPLHRLVDLATDRPVRSRRPGPQAAPGGEHGGLIEVALRLRTIGRPDASPRLRDWPAFPPAIRP